MAQVAQPDSDSIDMSALDGVYNILDRAFLAGDYEAVDLFLKHLTAKNAPVDFMLGVLTASFPAKSKLPARKDYFQRVALELGSREQALWEKDALLAGLE